MNMLDSQQRARIAAIGKLGFTNPFGPERPALEAIIVGEEVARAEPWSRSPDWPLDDPALPAIAEEAERLMAELGGALARGEPCDEVERELIRGLALYVLYYRYDAFFFSWTTAAATSSSTANPARASPR